MTWPFSESEAFEDLVPSVLGSWGNVRLWSPKLHLAPGEVQSEEIACGYRGEISSLAVPGVECLWEPWNEKWSPCLSVPISQTPCTWQILLDLGGEDGLSC